MDQTDNISLFNTRLMMRGMLDSGYKDTHYALAEIVDNSIEAGAKNIDIVIVQSTKGKKIRAVWQVRKIAVIDDGCGIAPRLLSRVLTFGDGTHEDEMRKGGDSFGRMGKYGFGLPNSSASQSDDIQVYSWGDGPESMHLTSLDVKKVLEGTMTRQTLAAPARLPAHVLAMMKAIGREPAHTGTVVLWDDVQRCSWQRADSLVDKIELAVGRIFRKFIEKGVNIRVSVFKDTDYNTAHMPARALRVNDPLFLMLNSLADAKRPPELPIAADEPLYDSVPPESVTFYDFEVPYETDTGEKASAVVKLRFSKCKPELRQRVNNLAPGSTEIGRLARENEGLSILRAGRELQLSRAWLPDSDTRHRWWGAEIDFPPALDDIFGVTNNKQSATKLEQMVDFDAKETVEAFSREWNVAHPENPRQFNFDSMIDEMRAADDSLWVLYKAVYTIKQVIREIFGDLKPDRASSPLTGAGEQSVARPVASDGMVGTDPSIVTGKVFPPGQSVPAAEVETLVDEEVPIDGTETNKSERERLHQWLTENPQANTYFSRIKFGSTAFFDCTSSYGKVFVKFNDGHPATQDLYLALGDLLAEDKALTEDPDALFHRLDTLKVSLWLMFAAWAKVETDLDEDARMRAMELRQEWGKRLRQLLEAFRKQSS